VKGKRVDADALHAWTTALAAWTPTAQLPAELRPQAFGLTSPRAPVPQPPWGPAAEAHVLTGRALASYLDHTLLRADATASEVRLLGQEARAYRLAGACAHALHARLLAAVLEGTTVLPVAVVGFPHGAHRTEVKTREAELAVKDGARELDVVAALGALKGFEVEAALSDMVAVVQAAHPWPVKLILETGLLDKRAVVLGAGLALVAGCAWVKTSTGTGPPGARVEDVALLRSVVGGDLGVKASGGIRTKEQARALVVAGASRLGTSSSLALLDDGTASRSLLDS
jgi:deoxyribose-phosphate aldolase